VADGVKESWQIRPERPEDAALVDALVAESFGPGRHAKAAYRLREGVLPDPRFSFVAVEGATLRGSVRFWPVIVGTENALLLGPLAVRSDQRGQGIGITLMNKGIEKAREAGFGAIILVGDEPYYGRVGFRRVAHGSVKFPGPVDPSRILALTLKDGVTLAGPVRRAQIDEPVSADGAALGAAA
jgi:predicted N-acetyltransferase YhbS